MDITIKTSIRRLLLRGEEAGEVEAPAGEDEGVLRPQYYAHKLYVMRRKPR